MGWFEAGVVGWLTSGSLWGVADSCRRGGVGRCTHGCGSGDHFYAARRLTAASRGRGAPAAAAGASAWVAAMPPSL